MVCEVIAGGGAVGVQGMAFMNPQDYLVRDHGRLRKQALALRSALSGDRETILARFSELRADILANLDDEAESFYGEAASRGAARELVHRMRNDHAAVSFALESLQLRLQRGGPLSEWCTKLEAMLRFLLSHFDSEEQELFPAITAHMDSSALDEMAAKLCERRGRRGVRRRGEKEDGAEQENS